MRRTAAFLFALSFLAGGADAAVSDYVGKSVASVRVVLEGRPSDDPMLTRMVETAVGQPLSMADVRQTVTRLFSLGRFEDVRVDATLVDGRVALRYELQPIHPVTRITFAGKLGAPGVDEAALRRAISDRYGATPPLGRAADMARIIMEALAERGYLHAVATPGTDAERQAGRTTLVFTVDPKIRTTIGAVDVVGSPTVSRPEFIRRLGLTPGAPFQREMLNARIDRYIVERRSQGYYEAKIVPDVKLTDDDRIANVTLTVSPGPRVRVVFAGDPPPADRRDELVPVQREGSVDEDLLEDSSNRIEEYFRALGYRDAKAPHSRAESDGELVITFTVTRGPLYRVARYDITGNASLPTADFEPSLRLREGQPFAENRLEADASAIEEVYRRRGYASARALPTIQVQPPTGGNQASPVAGVVISMVILEGVQTTVAQVEFSGNTALDDARLREKIGLQAGKPYVPAQLGADREAIAAAYRDLGYESAGVEAVPQFSEDRTRATLRFVIQEGPRVFVDHVLIVGNVRTSTSTIERELQLKPGDPLSLAALNESQRRLVTLGLFRRARINEVRHGGETTRDLLVSIEEAPPTTIHYGGGFEGRLRRVRTDTPGGGEDRFEVAPRASFQIGRRNLFGKNRSVNLFTSVSLHLQNLADTSVPSGGRVPEYRLAATYLEPHLFNTTADGFINGTFEQQIRTSFNYVRRGLSAGVGRKLTRAWNATGSYQLQVTRLFGVSAADVDPRLGQVFNLDPLRLSSFSGSLIRDTRDDQLDPHGGDYLSGSVQLAGEHIGSQVGFAKSFLDARVFRVAPKASRVVLAGNARLGMATEFGATPIPEPERFFAGGDTTVRGFPLDQLGTPDTISRNGFPLGGNGLVIFNAEARVTIGRGLQMVPFVDTGNVFAKVRDMSLSELRTAVGGGVRYKSPVGPLRFDLGFKVHPQAGEGRGPAWFFSFGQAF